MEQRQKLELQYDKLALDFFSLIDREKLSDNNFYLDELKKTYFVQKKEQEKMKVNIPLMSGKRIPDRCDVLTTYMSFDDPLIARKINDALDDILSSLPKGTDYYRTSQENYHISLVMIHDLRPVDMTNKELLSSRKSENEIYSIKRGLKEKIAKENWKSVELTFYGFRIGSDGAIIALLIDDGRILDLKGKIGDTIRNFLDEKYLNYRKPFIHTTVARIFDQVNLNTLLKLFEKQRKYFYIRDQKITAHISQFHLARETRWMHSNVDLIQSFSLR